MRCDSSDIKHMQADGSRVDSKLNSSQARSLVTVYIIDVNGHVTVQY